MDRHERGRRTHQPAGRCSAQQHAHSASRAANRQRLPRTVTMTVTRRALLRTLAGTAGAIVTAPMLNIGRFRLFAHGTQEYSARCIKLMQESTVLDMLSPLTISGKWQQWARD